MTIIKMVDMPAVAMHAEVLAYKESGFETFHSQPSMWPSFLVGQRDSPVRIAMVDGDVHFLTVLQQELAQDARIQIVGRGLNLKEGKRLCRSAEFDVLLCDLNLSDGSGFHLLGLMQAYRPSTQCIVVTVMDHDESISKALELGASGYLVKHSWFSNYAQSILQVANGGLVMTPHVAKRMFKMFEAQLTELRNQAGSGFRPQEPLSAREKDILRMVAAGYTSMEIGLKLEISHLTVNTHIKNIYRKLQVKSRAQAVRMASLRSLL